MNDLLLYNCYTKNFKLSPNEELNICLVDNFDINSFKKSIDMYNGFQVQTKKSIASLFQRIAISFYLDFVPKDSLFCVSLHAIVINNKLFILPADNCESKNLINLIRKSEKVYLYSFGVFEKNKFYIKFFMKKLRIKLCKDKSHVSSLDLNNIFCFFDSIIPNVIKIHGKNVFSNQFI